MYVVRKKLILCVQYAEPKIKKQISYIQIRQWVRAALLKSADLTIRFVNTYESKKLNWEYRSKNYATNVLTFANTIRINTIQADIIICTNILIKEAATHKKPLIDHIAHLIIHGVLHAQNYTHKTERKAMQMENLEKIILKRLGLSAPYANTM